MRYSDLMIDLEFMDTKPTAAILSIGAVFMDRNTGKMGPSVYIPVDLKSCTDWGMTMSADTVIWWLRQSEQARTAVTSVGEDLDDALQTLTEWIVDNAVDEGFDGEALPFLRVWQCGDLDCAILAHACQLTGRKLPWRFWNVRDYRTMREEFAELMLPDQHVAGMRHHALDDACRQAHHLLAIWGCLSQHGVPLPFADNVPVED